jgi:predicted Rossmann fold nucleotide-binding protein DprA/Smf involved in DNA uptake
MPNITAQITAEIVAKEREIARLRAEVSALGRALSALGGKVVTRRGPSAGKKRTKKARRRAKRGENPRRVLAAMSSKLAAVKDISAKSGVSSPTINAVLVSLTKQGKVERRGRGTYRLKGRRAPGKKPIVRAPAS